MSLKQHRVTLEEAERLYDEIAMGNKEAYLFIHAWQQYCHSIDDIVDGDVKDSEGIISTFFTAAAIFNSNFWKEYGKELYLVVALITNDYVDSNNTLMPQKDFLRGTGNNMLMAIAFIIGGYSHMRNISPKLRILSFKEHHDPITLQGD